MTKAWTVQIEVGPQMLIDIFVRDFTFRKMLGATTNFQERVVRRLVREEMNAIIKCGRFDW